MATISELSPNLLDGIDYPSGDGKPMAETPIHVDAIILLKEALDDFFEARPDVYIMADAFWYWERGNLKACKAPDVMVIPGVGRADRYSFFTWRENGAVPAAIFEMASKKTWKENLQKKKPLYESLGVKEYFIFDPEAKYLRPPLVGFRLDHDVYRDIRLKNGNELLSKELGLRLVVEGRMLRLVDKKSGQPIPTRLERAEAAEEHARSTEQRAKSSEQRAKSSEQRAEAAEVEARKAAEAVAEREAEIVRLKEMLEAALKKDSGSRTK